MTQENVIQNSENLKELNKIQLTEKERPKELFLGKTKVQCEITFDFNENKLNKIEIDIKEFDHPLFYSFLKENYGEPNLIYNGKDFLDNRILWISGNQQIQLFRNIARTGVVFEDFTNKKTIDIEKYIKDNEYNWYEGGTLHKAKIYKWNNATEKDKLATCADFMAKVDNTVSMTEL